MTNPPLSLDVNQTLPGNLQSGGSMQHFEDGVPRLSIVVPCYNEADGLKELYRRTSAVARSAVGNSWELVLVNDGSKDDSWNIVKELCASDPHVVGVTLARNYGHQLALSAGLELCRGERILVLDADLQDPPELLPPMMRLMDQGHDVVFGQRMSRKGETKFKLATAKLFYRLLDRLVDIEIPKDTGDFRLMNRRVLDQLLAMPERYRFIRGMVSWIGLSQVAMPYARDNRFAGETRYPLRKMLALAMDAITSFSTVPLRLASHLGIAFGLTGLLMLGYVLFSYVSGRTVQGWTSLAAVVLFLGSAQLLVLGVFGEYLGRMYMETKGRPLFIVDQIVRDRIEGRESPAADLQHQIKRRINAR